MVADSSTSGWSFGPFPIPLAYLAGLRTGRRRNIGQRGAAWHHCAPIRLLLPLSGAILKALDD